MAGNRSRNISLIKPGGLPERCEISAERLLLLSKLWRLASHAVMSPTWA
jgi:hypothetical protein